ncbi:uncharacterized protein YALI1_C07081g [Yarrowia lipolytica]|uniref:Uncharacterized protein n=1 Tax=Yarrowia lipolytica TaxID=4952 RepID=A0A1D8N9R4_YARLL|nr:hypothetical protein YALI1_C07081g [Yarrowia lipolytica]
MIDSSIILTPSLSQGSRTDIYLSHKVTLLARYNFGRSRHNFFYPVRVPLDFDFTSYRTDHTCTHDTSTSDELFDPMLVATRNVNCFLVLCRTFEWL